jgi:hypothetical protein
MLIFLQKTKFFGELNMKMKMKSKNLLVFFLTIASVLFLVATVNATDIAMINSIEVDGMSTSGNPVSIIAGETITVKVFFTAWEDASDVRVKIELEGNKIDVDARTDSFDIEDGHNYKKSLTLQVPYELKDEVSDDMTLSVKIWNGDFRTDKEINLRVQRPSYSTKIMSVSTLQKVDAGELLPIDIVLKNVGYNDLDDLYVTVKIPNLDVERTTYFGDLVAMECDVDNCDEDDEDTVSGRFYLQIPYDVDSGIYTLEVEAKNDDTINNVVKQITIENDFSSNLIVTSTGKTFEKGENAEYNLLLVNPTNKLKVYRIVTESSGNLKSTVSESVVAVPSGSSRTVIVTANAKSAGEYTFDVNVFSGEKLVDTVTLSAKVTGNSLTDPIVVLAIIMIIVFVVLLIVLIILLGKKPEKSEEFGESYY